MANVFILLRDEKKSQEVHRKRQFPLDLEIRASSNSGKTLTVSKYFLNVQINLLSTYSYMFVTSE
jgi:hypothetical protein